MNEEIEDFMSSVSSLINYILMLTEVYLFR